MKIHPPTRVTCRTSGASLVLESGCVHGFVEVEKGGVFGKTKVFSERRMS